MTGATAFERAHRAWEGGFDARKLPTRRQMKHDAEKLRQALHSAAVILDFDRAELTFAIREMQATSRDQDNLKRMVELIGAARELLAAYDVVFGEALTRINTAEARLELAGQASAGDRR